MIIVGDLGMSIIDVYLHLTEKTPTLQKSRMLQLRDGKGDAVIYYREPLTTNEIPDEPGSSSGIPDFLEG